MTISKTYNNIVINIKIVKFFIIMIDNAIVRNQMIDNLYKDQPREILKRKMGADQLLKKIEKGFQKFIHSPFKEENN